MLCVSCVAVFFNCLSGINKSFASTLEYCSEWTKKKFLVKTKFFCERGLC